VPRLLRSIIFGTPTEITREQIKQVVHQFVNAARLAEEAGFHGVEIHAAHGYLLTQFLSPESNHRQDEYGGGAANRARLVVDVIRAIRAVTSKRFCVGVKLNSVDYDASTDVTDTLVQVRAIVNAGIDFLEISGGSLADPQFNTGSTSQSTQKREAFFIEFAKVVRTECPRVPLIVTGGWRSRSSMNYALSKGSCDAIGLARASVLEPLLPRKVLLPSETPEDQAIAYTKRIKPPYLSKFLGVKLVGLGIESVSHRLERLFCVTYWLHSQAWYTERIQRMRLKTDTVVLTGANGGLGCAIVKRFVDHTDPEIAYHGIYTVRSPVHAESLRAVASRAEITGHTYDIPSLDLSNLASVRKFAEHINGQVATGVIPPIRSLILNAGYQEQTTQTFTEDGFDTTFQVNYLSHFLLALLLLQSMDRERSRIVLLSSWTHEWAKSPNVIEPRWLCDSTQHPNNRLGGFTDVYAEPQYTQMIDGLSGVQGMAKGWWSSAKAHPGDMKAGIRRYGAAKLCEVLFS
jgi:NAD(P)-dependent dehydrogenase (short-subunit alcohol dehydrogenase family)